MSEVTNGVKKIITDLFNTVSATFDEGGPRYFTYFGERLVEFADIKEGTKVLDVATGRGAVLFPVSAKVGGNGTVIGIDIAQGMIDEISTEIENRSIQNAQAMLMDAETLSFPDETFDSILCGFGVFFFPDYRKAFKEVKRVLKDGGRFGCTTFLRKETDNFNWIKELSQKYLPEQDIKAYVKSAVSSDFESEEGLNGILGECGFKNIKIVCEEKEFIHASEEEWWNRLWSQGSRLWLEKIPEKKLEQYKAEAFQKLKEIRKPEGIVFSVSVLYAFGEK